MARKDTAQGMKRDGLQKCICCGKGMMHNNDPFFYRMTLEYFLVDMKAVHRQAGLEQFIGSPVLASVMGPDDDIATSISKKVTVFICFTCSVNKKQSIAIIHEAAQEKKEEEKKIAAKGD